MASMRRSLAAALTLTSWLVPAHLAAQQSDWLRYEHGEHGYSWRYLPPALVGATDLPLVVFLHGYGSSPNEYGSALSVPAKAAGVVVLAPAAVHSPGWVRGVDEPTIDAALAAVLAELPIDPDRISFAGHSAGGAYAIELAYLDVRRVSGVFAMAAPFRSIPAIADDAWTAPIRMFYGSEDPNYATALPQYEPQWTALEVPYELEVGAGMGHNTLHYPAIEAGFRFLKGTSYDAGKCVLETPEATCLLDGRFRVELEWETAAGATGLGHPVAGAVGDDSVLLYYFAPNNWEMLVKVLDGCGVNGHVWVFAAAATDVAWTLTVTDVATGSVRHWTNPQGVRSAALTDTSAFPCDP